ncbi:MAG: hypothetical protein MK510_14375, partial [SAR324 cluster bacterium]|nr:hypothetical protein [SAR324 cluster bacterium]
WLAVEKLQVLIKNLKLKVRLLPQSASTKTSFQKKISVRTLCSGLGFLCTGKYFISFRLFWPEKPDAGGRYPLIK